ncbi:MAG: hypothetical protein IKC93_01120 [Candidatus Methanomethylophilaceae archaeon]|nr:hypothetical protein [Candidatus Methanomethylophilaceae archaeon]
MAIITVGGQRIEGNGKIEDIMRSNDQRPDAFIFIMEGVPVPSDTEVGDGEKVDAIRVASGG